MLRQCKDIQWALDRVIGDPIRGFTAYNFARAGEGEYPVRCLVDDLDNPRVSMVYVGNNFMVHGAMHLLNGALADLLEGRVETGDGWPDPYMQKDFDGHMEGRRGIFLNTSPYASWRAAIVAGFDPHPEDKQGQVAYQWHWDGGPRFGHLVRHDCRVVHGQELFELMKLAVHYDPEGHYIKLCLDNGPSFVCEVDGEPVCWSCTHLNGTMGMIYTPPELRRSGYARSLAAFQLDHMLGIHGLACCHVIDYNTASMNMVQGLGAVCTPEPLVWRMIWWPGEAPPPRSDDDGEPQAGDNRSDTTGKEE